MEIEIWKIIISIILAFVIAQGSKMIGNYRSTGIWDLSFFLKNGGMPSSHTSSVIAMTMGLLLAEGGITYFVMISAVFSMIVMNDAVMVRREVGDEAKILNQVMIKENIIKHRLSERAGHTPLQVAVGFCVGIVCALVVFAFF